MPGPDDGLGKAAEKQISKWLNQPKSGYSFDRIPDQMTGHYQVSRNICDFVCFKSPYICYIESKATSSDRFDFSMLSDTQHDGLLGKSLISFCYGIVIILFAEHHRAFILDIRDIYTLEESGRKSINIKKIDSWTIPYIEIPTIRSRKKLYDYQGDFSELVETLMFNKSDIEYDIPEKYLDMLSSTSAKSVKKIKDELSICELELGGVL